MAQQQYFCEIWIQNVCQSVTPLYDLFRVENFVTLQICLPFQVMLLRAAVAKPWIKTVCEVGFNAGHSTFNWLTANRNARVILSGADSEIIAKTFVKPNMLVQYLFLFLYCNMFQVYSFDLNFHNYSKPMAAYLSERFPGTV